MKRLTKILLWGVALECALAFFVVGYVAGRVATFEHIDDPAHIAAKDTYLARIGRRAGPNVVFILFDDLGYGDIGVYGSGTLKTPHIDALARQGARLTSFYSPALNCTPSRAGFLTGRYAPRTGMSDVVFTREMMAWVLQQAQDVETRMPADEILLPEYLKAAGYATGMFGKWHLGDASPAFPSERGFDDYWGLLHSNDMIPLRIYDGTRPTDEKPVEQSTLTERYTDRAVAFIDAHAGKPFFLYMPHTFPHVPLHSSEDHAGESAGGLYGDVVEDLDRSVGRVVDALRVHGVLDNTIIIVSSDNGPWHLGSPGGVRGRKSSVFEGAQRVPFIAWWPGEIPAGQVIGEPVMGIDLVPTLLGILDIPPPPDRVLDGRDILPVLAAGAPSPHEALYFYHSAHLSVVRAGRYRYHIRHPYLPGRPTHIPLTMLVPRGPYLFDIVSDPDESYDVSRAHPEQARIMKNLIDIRNAEMQANPRGWLN